MRASLAALATFLLLAPVANAQEATRFDLRCSGTQQEELNGPRAPRSFVLHVDLGAMQYCFDICDNVMPIERVLADRIVFLDRNEATARRNSMHTSEVSRVTGQYRSLWIESRPIPTYMETQAACEPAPFTSFPSRRF